MPRSYDRARRCLPVRDWPEADQMLWDRVTSPASLLDENRSIAASWRSETLYKYRRGYGRWINFVLLGGEALSASPADRVTAASVRKYIETLRDQGCAPYTQATRIAELLSVMLVFAPSRDWTWLKQKLATLSRLAEEGRELELPSMLAPEIAATAKRALDGLIHSQNGCRPHGLVAYRDWLMVYFLILLPLRLKNFAALSIGKSAAIKDQCNEIRIPAGDTKTGKAIRAPIPSSLSIYLRDYRVRIRPLLLRGSCTNRFWLSWTGAEMSEHAIYLRLTKFTSRELGCCINPHAFRYITATSISLLNPAEIDTARALLGHASCRTTQHHYIAANSLMAGERHAAIISGLRKRLLKPDPGPKKHSVHQ